MNSTSWLLNWARTAYPRISTWDQLEWPSALADQWKLVGLQVGLKAAELARQVALHFDLDVADFSLAQAEAIQYLPEKTAKRLGVFPLRADTQTLDVATADPGNEDALEQIRFASGRKVRFSVATPDDIESQSMMRYGLLREATENEVGNLLDFGPFTHPKFTEAINDPLVKLCRSLLRMAIDRKASDIHLHPFAGGGVVRFRIDGVLQRVSTLPSEVLAAAVRFFKANGKMDPTLSSVPQDGRSSLTVDNIAYDLRLSTLPAVGGESLVIRLLESGRVHSLEGTSLSIADRHSLRRITTSANGLFLMTGPTGSGKTSTLYALLASLNEVSRRIITVEEPVEYRMQGITQLDVNAKAGMSFQDSLRSILRQDPDILLVGEIRDPETADIAINAALTGHLVLSTLHTMDARRAVPRLMELGVSPTILADTLLGVMSQRLVRRLCHECRLPVQAPLKPLEGLFSDFMGEIPRYRAAGCKSCFFTGYRGRFPVCEIMEMTDPIREQLQTIHRDSGHFVGPGQDWRDIHSSASSWIVSGETTPEEVFKVLGLSFWNRLSERSPNKVPIYDAIAQTTRVEGQTTVSGLLVSPDETVADLQAALQAQGRATQWCKSAQEAGEVLQRLPEVQFLVLDVREHLDDGRALLKEMRHQLAWCGLPVVLLVRPDDTAFHSLLTGYGANDFVDVPPEDAGPPEARWLGVTARVQTVLTRY